MGELRILLVEDDEDDFVVARDLMSEIPDLRAALDWVRGYDEGIDRLRSGSFDEVTRARGR